MKTAIIATAAVIALAAPAAAESFKGGSPLDFALKHFATSHESGDGPRRDRFKGTGDSVAFTTQGTPLTARASAMLNGNERGSDADDE